MSRIEECLRCADLATARKERDEARAERDATAALAHSDSTTIETLTAERDEARADAFRRSETIFDTIAERDAARSEAARLREALQETVGALYVQRKRCDCWGTMGASSCVNCYRLRSAEETGSAALAVQGTDPGTGGK